MDWAESTQLEHNDNIVGSHSCLEPSRLDERQMKNQSILKMDRREIITDGEAGYRTLKNGHP